jgi:hypothetical protein
LLRSRASPLPINCSACRSLGRGETLQQRPASLIIPGLLIEQIGLMIHRIDPFFDISAFLASSLKK